VAFMIYAFQGSALPVWLLLAPRDYLSAFVKAGAVFALAGGILFVRPHVLMPALTRFTDGTGPVFAGKIFPFCFITIACGAISGFHSLISSGPTPRFVDRESDIRVVGYGAMLTESFVGVMALIAAVTLMPGVYLAMTMPSPVKPGPNGLIAPRDAAAITRKVSDFGPAYQVTPEEMVGLARGVGEKYL